MKTNLSSQIKLVRIPKRYYAPSSEIEHASLSRNEKIYTRIYESSVEGAVEVAQGIAQAIKKAVALKGQCTLGLGAGDNTLRVYAELVDLYKKGLVDFENVVVFNLGDFFPINAQQSPSTIARLKTVLLDKVNVAAGNIHTFGDKDNFEDIHQYCKDYEAEIEAVGGIDLLICELGKLGTLAFNEQGSNASSSCRLMLLSPENRQMIASSYHCDAVPTTAVTLGISNILAAKQVVCVAWGENNSAMVLNTVEGKINDQTPASFLQLHRHVSMNIDLPAAERLTRISHPWKVTSCEWTDKLIRRAIVWLCEQTGKPILKLTNKDYNDHGLSELLALYGSAYNVNIRIFNDLQHTITGWPGGKPNADDSNRPERANPYPKRVIVFSPHPDDDVISMGGTLKRLVDQHHDVHVAYETSGNIAVGDEDMMRYVMLMDRIGDRFGINSEEYRRLSHEIHGFINQKHPGDIDIEAVRYLKGKIRQCEATTACYYIGVKPENIHFCELPFYETGTIKKGDLGRRDVDIVKKLIADVKPHQIFVAGDLADPHGTHRVCTDAVLAAVDELLDEPWMSECRIWMYRGAWAEWEIDHIEMAVPISPEELRFKRNSILKHQSQMENAPFLGNDDRLFWQRAEDRNRATAELYKGLGLAAYEAIEAFVEYHPIH